MNRVWLLLLFAFFTTGCGEQAVVEKDDLSKSATAGDNSMTSIGEAAPPAREMDPDSDEEPTPAGELSDLDDREASTEEFFAFIGKNGVSKHSFDALNILARRSDLSDDEKSKVLDKLSDDYLKNEHSEESQALTASMILMGLGGDDYREDVSNSMIKRFLTGKEKLDRSSNQALSMLLQQGSSETKKKLTTTLVENFADDPSIAQLISRMIRGVPGPETEEFLTSLSEKSSNEKVQGTALMSLAKFYSSVADFKGYVKDEKFRESYSEETIEFISNFDSEVHAEKIEALLTRVQEEFADVEMGPGRTLGEAAEGELYVIQNLSIGKEAPDIVGEDLDGEEFKLSDYRGKVVMLDFWGDW